MHSTFLHTAAAKTVSNSGRVRERVPDPDNHLRSVAHVPHVDDRANPPACPPGPSVDTFHARVTAASRSVVAVSRAPMIQYSRHRARVQRPITVGTLYLRNCATGVANTCRFAGRTDKYNNTSSQNVNGQHFT